MFWEKIEKIKEISTILLTVLKVFKKNLDVLENFNKNVHYYLCIPLFFFQRKTLYINCVYNRIFPKIWGGPNALLAPPSKIWGGHGPLAPPVADPMGPGRALAPDQIENLLKHKILRMFFIVAPESNFFVYTESVQKVRGLNHL